MATKKTTTAKRATTTTVAKKAQANANVGLLSAADRKTAREIVAKIDIPFIWGIIIPDWVHGRRLTAAEKRQVSTITKNIKTEGKALVKNLQKLESVAAKMDKK